MSTYSPVVNDSMTMLRRNFVHMKRYPTVVAFVIGIPVVLMLLFVYVFGGTLAAGLPGGGRTRSDYADYLLPGILLLTVVGGGQGTSISVAMDMTAGIVARFKTMSISRSAVLAGHVWGTLLQTLAGVILVLGCGVLVGARPNATFIEWIAAFGALSLMAIALTWFSTACGVAAKTVESASNIPMPLLLLSFFSSGFAPTDSMPPALRWFADNQPFTPFTETLRGLLLGTPIGNDGWITVAWCVVITAVSYAWAMRNYDRNSSRQRGFE